MVLLLGIGFLAGVITAISPCVLPVLPILLAGGASGRKPLRIIAGLVASFSVFTLFATWLLSELGLPQDFLRNLAIVFLFVLAATLLVPQFALPARTAAGALHALPPKKAAAASSSAPRSGSSSSPAPAPCSRPSRSSRRSERRRRSRDPAHGRLRARRRRADARDRLRRPRDRRAAASSTRRRVRIGSGAADRASSRSGSSSTSTTTSRRSRPATRRSCRRRSRTTRRAKRELAKVHRRRRAGRERRKSDDTSSGLPGLRRRARRSSAGGAWINSHAADARPAARQGRADRLLDVLVHQLPAHAAAPEVVVRRVPQGRLRRSSACTRRSSRSST